VEHQIRVFYPVAAGGLSAIRGRDLLASGMSNQIRVVVTGVGVVSPIGIGRDSFVESLRQGRSGITKWDVDPAHTPPGPFLVARVNDFDGKNYIQPRKAIKLMSRELQTAYAASMLAFQESGIDRSTLDVDRIGTVFGSEMIYGDLEEYSDAIKRSVVDGSFTSGNWGSEGMRLMNPLWMLKYLPNMAACHVGIALDARGPNNTITSEENSGLMALIEAANVIRRGAADIMIVGATGNRVNSTRLIYRRQDKISQHFSNPAGALRPFDVQRDGTIEGEGAAALVIESLENAQRRNAKIIAEFVGWGSSCVRPIQPYGGSRIATANSLRTALQMSQIQASQLDHINANGNGTREEDLEEANAIAAIAPETPVTAIKSYFGSLGAATGLTELAASLWGISDNCVYPTLGTQQVDPACPIRLIQTTAKPWTQDYFAKLSQTCYGQAACVVLRKGLL
jgi:3-oxoacyl-[acyl-carrier-protein] synthase II